jgi:hypothetical protein
MNKDELEYIKENYFQEKPSLKLIFEMIDQVLNEDLPIAAATITPEAQIDMKLPVVRISEAWGRVDNADRDVIEAFASKIKGSTLEAKLTSLNNVLTREDPHANISTLLSTMMVCEVLSTILRDFTEAAGGFIFEGFLAGLFGGQSIQITGPEDIEGMVAAGKPITDVVLNDKHYSLKLLGPNTVVKGSFKNLVNHFETIDHVIYLDARRVGGIEGLEFGEFTITLETFLDVFFKPLAGIKKLVKVINPPGAVRKLNASLEALGDKVFQVKAARYANRLWWRGEDIQQLLALDHETLQSLAPFEIHYSEESFAGSKKARKLFGTGRQFNNVVEAIETGDHATIIAALKETRGYLQPEQFELTKKQAESIRGFKSVGTLMIGEQHMKTVWLRYAKILQEVINPIYGNLQEFTNNINAYLLGAGETDRKSRGQQAIHDAAQLQTATDTAVKIITPEETV